MVAVLALSAAALCPLAARAQARPAQVAQLDAYSEGPVFDYEGNLFVSHGTDSVSKITPEGRQSLWLKTEKPNGHKILPDGTHLLCVAGAVLHLDADGKVLGKAASAWNGVPLRAPNDLTLDDRGGFYFTDPAGSRESPIGAVYYVDRERQVRLVAGGLWVPNGLVLSPDRKRLYVAETLPNRVLWFEVQADGKLGPMNVFAELPRRDRTEGPDGLAVDSKGNLYVAHLGTTAVQVFSSRGKLLRTLPAGNFDASNLVWGGPKLSQLYITGSFGPRNDSPGRVYRLDLKGVRGISSLLPRQPKSGP
jgi:gluconolactonase